MLEDTRLKWALSETLTVGELIKILSEYPETMPVIITWESTLNGITQENVYESKEGNLYLDADGNTYKDEYAKTGEYLMLDEESIEEEEEKTKDEILDGFIYEIKRLINYWNDQPDRNSKEKIEGCAFSILCLLDGISGSWRGSLETLVSLGGDFMFHDQLYKKEKKQKFISETQEILAQWAARELEIQNGIASCTYCKNTENIISKETCCNGCSKLEETNG